MQFSIAVLSFVSNLAMAAPIPLGGVLQEIQEDSQPGLAQLKNALSSENAASVKNVLADLMSKATSGLNQ